MLVRTLWDKEAERYKLHKNGDLLAIRNHSLFLSASFCISASFSPGRIDFLFSFSFIFLRPYILEQFEVYSNIERQIPRLLIYSLPPTHSLPHDQHPPPEWDICYTGCTYIDTSSSPEVHSLPEFALGAVHSVFGQTYNLPPAACGHSEDFHCGWAFSA